MIFFRNCSTAFLIESMAMGLLPEFKPAVWLGWAMRIASRSWSNTPPLRSIVSRVRSKPAEAKQQQFEDRTGQIFRLPRFQVAWQGEGVVPPPGAKSDFAVYVRIEISGITKKVVTFQNFDPYWPRPEISTSYYQKLGLPDTFLDALSSQDRFFLGLPPLTISSPSK